MVLTVVLAACHSGAEMRHALLQADSLMYSRPDSALAILSTLDTSKATEAQFAFITAPKATAFASSCSTTRDGRNGGKNVAHGIFI